MFFSRLYDSVIQWSKHRFAPYCLAGVAFTESSFFPIPPDVMLVSMGLANPLKLWRYAFITTLFSILGGILGYVIGMSLIDVVLPIIDTMGYMSQYYQVVDWFKIWGVSVVFLAGFSPIPYKIFTISAGALGMPVLPFITVSLISRGLRFYLLALLLKRTGHKLDKGLKKYIDVIGWSTVIIFVIVYFVMVIS